MRFKAAPVLPGPFLSSPIDDRHSGGSGIFHRVATKTVQRRLLFHSLASGCGSGSSGFVVSISYTSHITAFFAILCSVRGGANATPSCSALCCLKELSTPWG